MIFNRLVISSLKNPKKNPLGFLHPSSFYFLQKSNYVDVYMKWKKDTYYESIEIVNRSRELKSLIAIKNCIKKDPTGSIPISAISKRGFELEVPGRVLNFLRKYPTVFHEFTGEKYNLPWFKLTQQAIDLDLEEQSVYQNHRSEILERLKKLLLMAKWNQLPLQIIHGMKWYLGLADDFLIDLPADFESVEIDPDHNLALRIDFNHGSTTLSVIQKNLLEKRGGELNDDISFPLFPSKGLRLKQKIEDWLDHFQKLPYVSPYEDYSNLDPSSDLSEKRLVGILHELLSLFVDHSAERKKILCLRKHLGLSQKFYRAFERHPHVFYLSPKNKTCTVILKEAYAKGCGTMIEKHPILKVRKKYVRLMRESEIALKQRRHREGLDDFGNVGYDPKDLREQESLEELGCR